MCIGYLIAGLHQVRADFYARCQDVMAAQEQVAGQTFDDEQPARPSNGPKKKPSGPGVG